MTELLIDLLFAVLVSAVLCGLLGWAGQAVTGPAVRQRTEDRDPPRETW